MTSRERLAQHGFAVFEDRLIRNARPPIGEDVLARIAAECSGPIPESLVALWRTSFGGALAYDLVLDFAGRRSSMSFRELFHPGSRGYRDLWGWIEHEKELAEEAAEEADREWSGKLDYLPFGGFEYLERFYVKVAPGKDYGAVFVWQQGLPPAWVLAPHEDASTRAADDVHALFRMLSLEEDPFGPAGTDATGFAYVEAIEEIEKSGDDGRTLGTELRRLLSSVVLDWKGALAAGTIANAPRLRALALLHAAADDDVGLLQRLSSAGCDLDERIRQDGSALDCALAAGSMRAARFLIDRGGNVRNAIRNGASHATLELVEQLLARGAEPDPIAVLTAADRGHLEGALRIARECVKIDPSTRERLRRDALKRAASNDDSADRVERGQMGSNLTPADYRERSRRHRALAAGLDEL